jgi:hypothetical protein
MNTTSSDIKVSADFELDNLACPIDLNTLHALARRRERLLPGPAA